jgi:hypothetical protein
MSIHCMELFRYAASRVSWKDVEEFVRHDDLVFEWNHILSTRSLPTVLNFEISEPIGFTQRTYAGSVRHPPRFRRFRIFTNSTGLAMAAAGMVHDSVPVIYLMANLIEDARHLSDPALNGRLLSALDEFETLPGVFGVEDRLFVQLSRILVRLMTQQDEDQIPQLTEMLIKAESQVPKVSSAEFLWGCTNFNQLHVVWKKNVGTLIPKRLSDFGIGTAPKRSAHSAMKRHGGVACQVVDAASVDE